LIGFLPTCVFLVLFCQFASL